MIKSKCKLLIKQRNEMVRRKPNVMEKFVGWRDRLVGALRDMKAGELAEEIFGGACSGNVKEEKVNLVAVKDFSERSEEDDTPEKRARCTSTASQELKTESDVSHGVEVKPDPTTLYGEAEEERDFFTSTTASNDVQSQKNSDTAVASNDQAIVDMSNPTTSGSNTHLCTPVNTSLSEAQRCMSLYFALCTKKHTLLRQVFSIYKRSPDSVKQAIDGHMPILVRTMGSSPSLLEIISDPPDGSENLLIQVLHILTESTAPSAELLVTIKKLYESKIKNVEILFPILSSLPKEEVLRVFPQVVNLPQEKFQTALSRLLQGSTPNGSLLTPAEVLIAIHSIDPDKDGIPLKKESQHMEEDISSTNVTESDSPLAVASGSHSGVVAEYQDMGTPDAIIPGLDDTRSDELPSLADTRGDELPGTVTSSSLNSTEVDDMNHDHISSFGIVPKSESLPSISTERSEELSSKTAVVDSNAGIASTATSIGPILVLPKLSAPVVDLSDEDKDMLQKSVFVRILEACKQVAVAGGSQLRFSVLASLGVEESQHMEEDISSTNVTESDSPLAVASGSHSGVVAEYQDMGTPDAIIPGLDDTRSDGLPSFADTRGDELPSTVTSSSLNSTELDDMNHVHISSFGIVPKSESLPSISTERCDEDKDMLQNSVNVRILEAYKQVAVDGGSQLCFSVLASLGVEYPLEFNPWTLLQTHIVSDFMNHEAFVTTKFTKKLLKNKKFQGRGPTRRQPDKVDPWRDDDVLFEHFTTYGREPCDLLITVDASIKTQEVVLPHSTSTDKRLMCHIGMVGRDATSGTLKFIGRLLVGRVGNDTTLGEMIGIYLSHRAVCVYGSENRVAIICNDNADAVNIVNGQLKLKVPNRFVNVMKGIDGIKKMFSQIKVVRKIPRFYNSAHYLANFARDPFTKENDKNDKNDLARFLGNLNQESTVFPVTEFDIVSRR